jgi:hypothetical protein
MLSFNEAQIRNTEAYRNAILSGYKIFPSFSGEYMTFKVKKGNKETAKSGKIQTYAQFNEQLMLFIQELI